MYSVFNRVPEEVGKKHIIFYMKQYILAEGSKIVKNEENLKDPNKFTNALLDFKT